VRDDVDGFGQAHDRIADELAGAVPRDLAAAVDVDDGRAVRRPLVARARARREDGLVLEQQRVGAVPGDDLGVDSRAAPRHRVGRVGASRPSGRRA
jgi:hypothetical protein